MLPNLSTEHSYAIFDKEAQGAYGYRTTITQEGDKIMVHEENYDPYTNETTNEDYIYYILAYFEELQLVKLGDNQKQGTCRFFDLKTMFFVDENKVDAYFYFWYPTYDARKPACVNLLAKLASAMLGAVNYKKMDLQFDSEYWKSMDSKQSYALYTNVQENVQLVGNVSFKYSPTLRLIADHLPYHLCLGINFYEHSGQPITKQGYVQLYNLASELDQLQPIFDGFLKKHPELKDKKE